MREILRRLAHVINDIVYFLQVDAVMRIMIVRPVDRSDNALPCPMCKSEFVQTPSNLKNFNFDDYYVTKPNREEVTFKQATLEYLQYYFQDVETCSQKIPAAFDFDQDERFDFAITDEEIEEKLSVQGNPRRIRGPRTLHKIKEDRKQILAVEKLAQIFFTVGKNCLGPMFVISEFKFENFLKNVKIPRNEKRMLTVYDGDHDIVIISLQKGVIFVQVKSVERVDGQTAWNAIKRAFEQVHKDALAMKTMNRDLHFINKLPMHSFVAVPNISDVQLDDINICKNHRSYILTANQLSERNFTVWLSNNFSCKKSGFALLNAIREVSQRALQHLRNHKQNFDAEYALSLSDYKILSSRYIGLASMVKFRTRSDAINKMGGRVSRIMLNPEQKQCLAKDERLNILLGDFGTGKSVVLMQKAKKVAEGLRKELVYVISLSVVSAGSGKVQDEDDNLVPHLEGMMKHIKNGHTNIKVMRFLDYLKHVGRCNILNFPQQPLNFPFQLTPDILCELMDITLKENDKAHFFFDEMPLCLGLCKGKWGRFEAFCRDNESVSVWISIATGSFSLRRDETFASLDRFLPRTFSKTIFNRCMRTTVNNFKLLKACRKFKGDGLYKEDLSFHGNVIHGTQPMWLEMSPCSCQEVEDPYQCKCVERRLQTAIDFALKKVDNVDRSHITILLHDTSLAMTRFLAEILKNVCDVLVGEGSYKFKVSSIGDKRPRNTKSHQTGMTVVDLWSYKGNESKVVIFVDAYGGPIVWTIRSLWHGWNDICISVSRSVAHFVFVTWPPDEQQFFLLDFAKHLTKKADDTEDKLTKNFYRGVAQAIRDGRSGHFWENKNFMDFLVSQGTLEKYSFQES